MTKNALKIAYIVPALIKRGPVIFTENIINGLAGQPDIHIEVFHVDNRKGVVFRAPVSKLTLGNLKRLFEFDIVHSTQFVPDLLVALLPLGRRRKVTGMLNFIEEDLGYRFPRVVAWPVAKAWYWALKRFNGIIYYSDFMEKYYTHRLRAGKFVTIDPGVPAPTPEPIDRADDALFKGLRARGLRIIGTVCMINRRKGLDQLIHCLAAMPDCAVVVVGEGAVGEGLNQLAVERGVKDRFHIIGFRDRSARYNLQFDIYAMVSRSEGYGLAMLEALGSGIPVVCSRLPIYTESIGEQELAFFSVDDLEDLSRTLRKVLDDPAPWAAAALDLFSRRFSLEAMCLRHLQFYRRCLESSHSKGPSSLKMLE